MAGGQQGSDNSSYYLYTNKYYWSGSPGDFRIAYSSAIEFSVGIDGLLDAGYVNAIGARPVVSLSSKAKLLGNGTYNDVYTVS